MRGGRGEIGAAVAAGRQHRALGAKQVQRALGEVQREHAAAGTVGVHDQVEREILDEELGVMRQRLLVQRVQDRVAGAVGGGAGALRGRAFAVLGRHAAERTLGARVPPGQRHPPPSAGCGSWLPDRIFRPQQLDLGRRQPGADRADLDGGDEPVGWGMKVTDKLRTPLKRARGLGSAKDGTGHFILQRITAIALVFLSIYVVGLVVWLIGADYAVVRATVAEPCNALLLVAFLVASFWHAKLGMQVIVEDYVHTDRKSTRLNSSH